MQSRFWRAATISRVSGLVVVLAAVAWLLTPALPWLDDAYISLHSAQSILAGGDPQYGTPPLTGVTSPPYVLLLTLLLAMGVGPLPAIEAASATGLIALALALWALGRSLGLPGWRQFALPIAVLAMGQVIDQATNGVETGWAMAVSIALIAACVAGRPIAAAAAAGVLPWLRPDLLPLAGLMLLAALWTQPPAARLRAVAVAALAFVPWSLWIYADTGNWIPQTMAAKAAFFATGCAPFGSKAAVVGGALVSWSGLVLPVSLLGLAFSPFSSPGRLTLAACLVTIAAYFVVFPGGLWHNYHRYLYPIGVPLVALGMGVSMKRPEFTWRAATMAVVAAAVLLWPTNRLTDFGEATERLDAAAWVKEHLDAEATLLVQDAGAVSVFTDNPLVDLVGLKTPASIAVHRAVTQASCGADRAKAIATIARSSGAEYVIVTSTWDAIFSLTAGLEQQGVKLEPLRSSRTTVESYNVYRMRF